MQSTIQRSKLQAHYSVTPTLRDSPDGIPRKRGIRMQQPAGILICWGVLLCVLPNALSSDVDAEGCRTGDLNSYFSTSLPGYSIRLEESVERPSPVGRLFPVSIEAVARLANEYVWRGRLISNKQTAHPSLTLAFGNTSLSLNVWGAVALQGREGFLILPPDSVAEGTDPPPGTPMVKSTDEVNLTLSFDRNLGGSRGFGLSGGFTQYVYPNATENTRRQELFMGVGLGNPIAPALTAFYGLRSPRNLYLVAGFYPQFYLDPEGTTLVTGRATVGFSDIGGFGFNDLTVSLTTTLRKGILSVGPVVGYVISDGSLNLKDGKFLGGLEIRLIQ